MCYLQAGRELNLEYTKQATRFGANKAVPAVKLDNEDCKEGEEGVESRWLRGKDGGGLNSPNNMTANKNRREGERARERERERERERACAILKANLSAYAKP